jgi:hypothetical protein
MTEECFNLINYLNVIMQGDGLHFDYHSPAPRRNSLFFNIPLLGARDVRYLSPRFALRCHALYVHAPLHPGLQYRIPGMISGKQ